MNAWLLRVLLALDCAANVAFRGLPGETISARAATARRDGRVWGCVLCRLLDWLQPGHCAGAVQGDVRRAQEVERDLA